MRLRRRLSGGARAALAALVTAAAGAGAFSSCFTAPPDYPDAYPMLRLVPAEGSVDDGGGQVFVLVELQTSAPGTGGAGGKAGTGGATTRYMVFVTVSGATTEALPGPDLCGGTPTGSSSASSASSSGSATSSSSASSSSTGNGGSTSSSTGGGSSASSAASSTSSGDGGAGASPSTLTITTAQLLDDTQFHALTSGFVAIVPQGSAPVQLVATAYAYTDSQTACALTDPGVTNPQIVAIGTATIDRSSADAGGTGGGGTGGKGGTGGGGTGGKGGTGGGGT